MASTSRRLGLHAPTGGDPADAPADFSRLRDQLDAQMLGYAQGTLASRPTAGVEGRMYYATDAVSLYYDTGTAWIVNGYQAGDVRWTGRSALEPGWLACNGAAVSRATYAALYAALDTRFGRGDGATTFNLPNLQGRFALGASSTKVVGSSGGTESHQHGVPSHSHGIAGGAAIRQDLYHTVTFVPYGGPAQQAFLYVPGGDVGPISATDGGGPGNTNATSVLPPYLALSAWIKT